MADVLKNGRNKVKVIVFGASTTAKNLTLEIMDRGDPYEILAYADNDTKKQGNVFCGKEVIHPNKIASYDYDQIIIGSIGGYDITKQLVDEYGISPGIINTTMVTHLIMVKARIIGLENAAKLIYRNNVSGSVAELGVFEGEFAKHINKQFPERKLYLFDTFDGFSDEDIKKEKEIGSTWAKERSYRFAGGGGGPGRIGIN
jgi:O-methyltransferase